MVGLVQQHPIAMLLRVNHCGWAISGLLDDKFVSHYDNANLCFYIQMHPNCIHNFWPPKYSSTTQILASHTWYNKDTSNSINFKRTIWLLRSLGWSACFCILHKLIPVSMCLNKRDDRITCRDMIVTVIESGHRSFSPWQRPKEVCPRPGVSENPSWWKCRFRVSNASLQICASWLGQMIWRQHRL